MSSFTGSPLGGSPLSGLAPLGAVGAAGAGGRGASDTAREALGEVGHRVLAWTGAAGGEGDAAGWSKAAGAGSGFVADPARLAGGGDVYGLADLAGAIARDHNATPMQEGDLRRALEDFTRAAVVQVVGLSGAGAERQTAGLAGALGGIGASGGGEGIEGVTARIADAAASLQHQNGG